MVKYKYLGKYIIQKSGCGCNGTLKKTMILQNNIPTQIEFTNDIKLLNPNYIYEFEDYDENVIMNYINNNQYGFTKVD